MKLRFFRFSKKKYRFEVKVFEISKKNRYGIGLKVFEFESKNSIYLNKLLNEENVQLRQFPKDVLDTFKSKTEEVIREMIETDSKSKKIFEAYDKFRVSFKDWSTVSDRIYYEL